MQLRLCRAAWLFLLALLVIAPDAFARQITHHRVAPITVSSSEIPAPAAYHLGLPPGETLHSVRILPRVWSTQGDPSEPPPESWPIESSVVGTMRGQDVLGFNLNHTWNTPGGTYVLREFDVVVETRPQTGERLIYYRESPTGARSFDAAWKTLTRSSRDNGSQAGGLSRINSGEPHHPTFRPSVTGSPVDMVIITDSAQETEYQRLADFKTQTGILTVVRTVDWIQANYAQGVDAQETIRNFIREAATLWGTAWIVLGGDTEIIPVRLGFNTYFGSEDIPTDLYYSALDGTWDADGDGTFGEAPVDSCDLYPDVWVGRMPSRNISEAQILVDKTLAYQATPTLGYQKDYLLLGEVLAPESWTPGGTVFLDGAVYCDTVDATKPAGTSSILMYENYTAWPGAVLLDKPVVIDSINAGFHLVHHVGHGFINTMSLGFEEKTLINSDADAFTNGSQTFLLYAINCTSSAIDFNCLAERFMLNPNGGSVASVGSTRWDFPLTGASYQDAFYDLLFQQGTQELGMAMAMSKLPFIPNSTYDGEHRWTQFTQIYLGDPSLRFWLTEPETLVVAHSGTYTLKDYSYGVDVSFQGSPAESAWVTVFKDGDDFATGWTDVFGHADLAFNPDETGSFSVGATYPNAVPHIGTAQVVTQGGTAYLFASGQSIDDDGAGNSSGNSDGLIDAGETIELSLTLKNSGTATEFNIVAQISTSDPYVSIGDNASFYDDIPAGQSLTPNDPFLITLAANTPDQYEATLSLFVFSDDGPFIQEVLLYVHAPVYEYYQQAIRDTVGNGNGDGLITPGEDFVILPTLRNLGLGSASGLEVRLRSNDGAVTIVDSIATVGTLASGAITTTSGDGLQLSLSDTTSYHQLQIVLLDDRGEIATRLIDWKAPSPISDASTLTFGTANAIALYWGHLVAETDLWGYNVYRASSETGPYTRINQNTTNGIAYFSDETLPALTRYYYKIAAIDTSGNESSWSGFVSGTTTLPLHPGWPVSYSTATSGGVTIADLDGDMTFEILAAGEEVYVLNADGTEFLDGDSDVRTLGPFSQTGGSLFWNTPAVADIDLDGTVDIAAVSWDAQLWVWDSSGNIRSGFPKDVNPFNDSNPAPLGSVSFGDCNADGKLEILCSVGSILFIWEADGTELADGDSDGGTDGIFAITATGFSYGTPTVANIDGDPFKEIIAGMRDGKLYVFRPDGSNYPGFPFATGDDITTPPVVGDIDGDGNVEIIFGSANENLYALRADLTQPGSWPVAIQLMQDQAPAAALGDLTGDGNPDVVLGASNGTLWAFDGPTGNVLTNFPLPILDGLGNQVEIRSSAALADLDNDGTIDIIVGDQLGRLHGYDATGGTLAGFPIQTGNLIQGSPAVWDVDGDGLNEVVVQSFDQQIYCWDTPWSADSAKSPWPMFKANQRNSGVSGEDTFNVIGVGNDPENQIPLLIRSLPNPARHSVSIQYRVPGSTGSKHVNLSIYNIQGRLVKELVDEDQSPGIFGIDWNFVDASSRKLAAGIYPYRLQIGDQVVHRKLVLLP